MGLATYIEEYVPIIMPTIKAKAKSWMIPPPKTNSEITTTRVVKEVSKVRLIVSFILLFIIISRGFL